MGNDYNPGEIEEILKRYTGDGSKTDKDPFVDISEDITEETSIDKAKDTKDDIKKASKSESKKEPKKDSKKDSKKEPAPEQEVRRVSKHDIMKSQAEKNNPGTRMLKEKKRKKKNRILNLLLVFFSLVFIGSALYIGYYFYNIHKAESSFQSIKDMIRKESHAEAGSEEKKDSSEEETIKYVTINGVAVQERFADIYTANNDFIGWLTVEGTDIDYPVMYTPNDEQFYLKRDFYKENSSSGTLFCAADCNPITPSDNVLIYGHNMKAGTMFHDLLEYEDEEYYKEHKYIQFDTIDNNATYEVIAAFRTVISEDDSSFKYYEFFNASSEDEFNEYVSKVKSKTPYTIDTNAVYGEKLLTLSTCAYHANEGRYVVVAKKIK